MGKKENPFLHRRSCHDQSYTTACHGVVTYLITEHRSTDSGSGSDLLCCRQQINRSQWNHIVTLMWRGSAPIPTNNSILLYPPGICCHHRHMIVFIFCLCPEPTGQVVADHRLLCDTEVKLITHDFLAWPNRYLQKSAPSSGWTCFSYLRITARLGESSRYWCVACHSPAIDRTPSPTHTVAQLNCDSGLSKQLYCLASMHTFLHVWVWTLNSVSVLRLLMNNLH